MAPPSGEDIEPPAPQSATATGESTSIIPSAVEGADTSGHHSIETSVTIQIGRRETVVLGKANPALGRDAPEEVLRRQITEAIQKQFAKPASEVVERLSAAANAHEAVRALKQAKEDELLAFPPSRTVLDRLETFDLPAASKEDRQFLRTAKLEVAQVLGEMTVVAREAAALLEEFPDRYSDAEKASFEMAVAIGMAQQGRPEAALEIWRRQLASTPPPSAETRGWLWRNIARTVDAKDPGARDAARHSADAFLEAGNKEQALGSLAFLADQLLHDAPERGFGIMDEMLEIAGQEGLPNVEVRAGIHHNRGTRLLAFGAADAALEDGLEAVKLRRGLLGVENRLAGSLNLVAAALTALGRMPEAQAYSEEADALVDAEGRAHFAVAHEISGLFKTFDRAAAERIEAEGRRDNKLEVVASAVVVRAMGDPDLKTEERLALLEGLLQEMDNADAPGKMTVPARRAIASVLTKAEQHDRAAQWLRKLLDDAPWEASVVPELANAYFRLKDWKSAIALLQSDVDRRGGRPGVLYFLGEAHLEAGHASEAVTILQRSFMLAPEGSEIKEHARRLRDKALDAGGTLLLPKPKPVLTPVTKEEFEDALKDFARMIAADFRMTFWRRDNKGQRKWISNPEAHGGQQLRLFLKSHFRERIEIFNEIDAGAGRLDVLVQLAGGLSLILELKMCGAPYSSGYAAEGEVQVLHYMTNRGVHLGYLLVFDGRMQDYGQSLLKARPEDGHTVVEQFVDVRPEVKPSGPKAGP